jgi:ribonucleoside-diphosphate reductase alpha chain
MKTYSKFYWLNENSQKFLKDGYLLPGVTPKERIKQISNRAEDLLGIKGFSDKFYGYMERGFFSLSSPVWSNFGLDRGLPISCYGIDIQDSTDDILRSTAEIGMLTKMGGGTAGYFGKIRGRGEPIKNNGVSNGSVAMMQLFQGVTDVISQGQTRRGYFAAYQDAEHPDIEEFLDSRGEGHPIQDIALGVCLSDNFMEEAREGDKKARKTLAKIHKKRFETGFPYIFFTGNVDRSKPQVYKDKNLTINHSQMCTEIIEYTDEFKTFVCCLSSLNLLHWDEIKETDAIETLTYFLDAVYTEFIEKADGIPFMEKAVRFAKEHRSIGVGVLGWHSYLQSKMIPFEGMDAKRENASIFKLIDEKTLKASKELAVKFGEPKMLEGYGERFTTRIAPAPTTSSAFILGQVSPSIEPLHSNYFIKDLAKLKVSYKNPYLVELLEKKGKDNNSVWKSIMTHGGSVQHLEFLTEEEKDVFKTFGEISQLEIVQQAAQRQRFIDQSQSLNLMIHPDTPVKDVNKLLYEAWESGVKTLYYQRSVNMAQQVSRDILNCSSCEG